ncbi:MAG: glutaredoxin domain-containing protein [Xanthomonadales bacterium]|nr:glutaredoxin domain-containing protein [Xanthomonadales bacterium]
MNATERLQGILQSHSLIVFMRGTPDKPMCQGSFDVVEALGSVGADYLHLDLRQDPEVRAFLPKQSDWGGVPQVFLNGEFLGGAEVVCDLLQQGELQAMVSNLQPEFLAAS